MQRYDARLVRDACGNADVLMKEAHDGLFVRHADAMERERVLREDLYAALRQWRMYADDQDDRDLRYDDSTEGVMYRGIEARLKALAQ